MPSLADLEEWMEEQIPQSLHDLPMRVHATLQAYSAQLYDQLKEIAPTIQQLESQLSTIVNQPILPPQPPPPSYFQPIERTQMLISSFFDHVAAPIDRITGNRRRTSIVAGIALAGLSVRTARAYTVSRRRSKAIQGRLQMPRSRNGARTDAVVVLGADTALGHVLSHALAARGFIVIGSVSSEQSKQSFDSLVPPSMRGYIKTIILPANETQTEHISQFVRTISAARQLRWPLTAAGDPYARAGSEIDIVAVVNALSYVSPLDEVIASGSSGKSATSLDVNRLADDLQRRVVTPLATMRALLPILNTRHSQDEGATSPPIVISLTHPGGMVDIAAKALNSGMYVMAQDEQSTDALGFYSRRRTLQQGDARKGRVNILTLEAHPTTIASVFHSLLPEVLGGTSVLTVSWPSINVFKSLTRMSTEEKTTASNETSTSILSDGKTSRGTRSSSSVGMMRLADLRASRQDEHQLVVRAALELLVRSSVVQGGTRWSTYTVRLPASHTAALIGASTNSNDGKSSDNFSPSVHFEPTVLAQLFSRLTVPVYALGRSLRDLASAVLPFRPFSSYTGTRNQTNARPAYEPGPGPASNTHSRSCIRTTSTSEQDGGNACRRRTRPASTASTTSSDHARSSESESVRGDGVHASRPASSGPPSNPDMSSSGILSSVPSSAFGDASEEDHYGDSDFVGTDSPIVGDRGGNGTWHGESAIASSTSSDDHDDSGTALGVRPSSANNTGLDSTPHASRLGSGDANSSYGFPSHASMQTAEEHPWMGPQQSSAEASGAGQGASTPAASAGGVHSPLGQSWVALGQSSTQQGTS